MRIIFDAAYSMCAIRQMQSALSTLSYEFVHQVDDDVSLWNTTSCPATLELLASSKFRWDATWQWWFVQSKTTHCIAEMLTATNCNHREYLVLRMHVNDHGPPHANDCSDFHIATHTRVEGSMSIYGGGQTYEHSNPDPVYRNHSTVKPAFRWKCDPQIAFQFFSSSSASPLTIYTRSQSQSSTATTTTHAK